jgi:hypothetical protein
MSCFIASSVPPWSGCAVNARSAKAFRTFFRVIFPSIFRMDFAQTLPRGGTERMRGGDVLGSGGAQGGGSGRGDLRVYALGHSHRC